MADLRDIMAAGANGRKNGEQHRGAAVLRHGASWAAGTKPGKESGHDDEVVLRTSGLTKTYRNGGVAIHALRGQSLRAAERVPGDPVIVGIGEVDFLNILGGLKTASAGQTCFQTYDLVALDQAGLAHYRRDHVGFVFQF